MFPLYTAFPDLTLAMGARIRALRGRRSISLSALALDTGLGKATLSEIERGRRNPTLDTLFAIATSLEVPLGELLTDEEGPAESARARGENLDAELLDRWAEGDESVEVYRMAVSAGVRRSRPHAPGVSESLMVISGAVRVGVVGAPVRLTAGQSHSFPGDVEHLYEGLAETSTTVLVLRYAARPEVG